MDNCGTVLVVDDDAAFRRLVEELLGRWGCDVSAARTADEGLALAASITPDLAIVAVELPDASGLTVLRELQDRFGEELRVILTSAAYSDAFDRTAGLLLGADDYLVKPVDRGELAARIRRPLRRLGFLANGNGGRPAASIPVALRLSPRELEILRLLAAGRSQKEIASTLVISSKTVATHIQHVLGKLGVHSRAEAVAAAYRSGLVDGDVVAHTLDAALIGAD